MFLQRRLALPVALTTLFPAACFANPTQDAATPVVSAPVPEIFAPGEISGPANDGAPTFSPDGNTLFFTRSTAQWTVIVESHKLNGHWSRRWLRHSRASGPTRPRQCRPMALTSSFSRRGQRFLCPAAFPRS
jgi:WD40-like Beta Propeller Repeat